MVSLLDKILKFVRAKDLICVDDLGARIYDGKLYAIVIVSREEGWTDAMDLIMKEFGDSLQIETINKEDRKQDIDWK